MPQLELSVRASTHAVPQAVWPAGQAQLPATQVCAPPQTRPQEPQLATLVAVLTQTPPQSDWPAGQAQLPAVQTWPEGQALSQAPQLVVLLLRSTQVALAPVPHALCPLGQTHTPAAQV